MKKLVIKNVNINFFIILVVFPMIASVVIGMDLTTIKPETTTEDTSGRLLSLPISEKCAESKCLITMLCFIQ